MNFDLFNDHGESKGYRGGLEEVEKGRQRPSALLSPFIYSAHQAAVEVAAFELRHSLEYKSLVRHRVLPTHVFITACAALLCYSRFDSEVVVVGQQQLETNIRPPQKGQ